MTRIWVEKPPPEFTDEQLVEKWLSMHREHWFNNPINGLFGYEQQYRAIAEYWLKNGKHGEDYNDHYLIYGMKMWDEFIGMFAAVGGKRE